MTSKDAAATQTFVRNIVHNTLSVRVMTAGGTVPAADPAATPLAARTVKSARLAGTATPSLLPGQGHRQSTGRWSWASADQPLPKELSASCQPALHRPHGPTQSLRLPDPGSGPRPAEHHWSAASLWQTVHLLVEHFPEIIEAPLRPRNEARLRPHVSRPHDAERSRFGNAMRPGGPPDEARDRSIRTRSELDFWTKTMKVAWNASWASCGRRTDRHVRSTIGPCR